MGGATALVDGLWDRRALLISGKGGVGKTSVAAALARAAVNAGRRVLLAEVEVGSETSEGPSLLGELVGARVNGASVTPVSPNLSFVRQAPHEGRQVLLPENLPPHLPPP